MTLRIFLKRIVEGGFPGSPDCDYVELSAKEAAKVDEMFKGRWCDTKEQEKKKKEA